MSAPLQHTLHDSAQLDRVFGALSDPSRRRILARLAQGDASVNELVALVALSQPAVSKHIKVLEAAGLISRGRNGQVRPCHLEAQPLLAAHVWLGDYRRFFEASFDRLDELLTALQGETQE